MSKARRLKKAAKKRRAFLENLWWKNVMFYSQKHVTKIVTPRPYMATFDEEKT